MRLTCDPGAELLEGLVVAFDLGALEPVVLVPVPPPSTVTVVLAVLTRCCGLPSYRRTFSNPLPGYAARNWIVTVLVAPIGTEFRLHWTSLLT